MQRSSISVLPILAAAIAGASLAAALGLPAGPLLGASVAVAILVRFRAGEVPEVLRDVAFAIIGVTIGAGIGPGTLQAMAQWPISFVGLIAVVLATIALSGAALSRLRPMDRGTTVLAVTPGALSVVVGLAVETGRDTRTVVVMQSVRLLAVTILLPPVLGVAGDVSKGTADTETAGMGAVWGAGLVMLAFGLGRLAGRRGFPAALMLSGIAVSGVAHAAGWTVGRPPAPLAFAGFALAGAVVGSRLSGVSGRELRSLGSVALGLTVIATAVSACGAFAVSTLLGLPFGQVMVAFAPGGIEAMASMAITLGYDPFYVGAHHVGRLLLLIVLLPALVNRM